ncbi:MAG TPA: thioredoxin family protein [Cellulomonas sp.]
MLLRVVVVIVVLVLATGLGLWWNARNGRFTVRDDAQRNTAPRVGAAELGAALGSELTFLQFSSEVCAPCRRASVVLGQLATERPGLAHVEIDVVEHLDLVRRFDVMRTPTVLLLDTDGVVVGRMSGALDRRHALAALESCPGTVSAR